MMGNKECLRAHEMPRNYGPGTRFFESPLILG